MSKILKFYKKNFEKFQENMCKFEKKIKDILKKTLRN